MIPRDVFAVLPPGFRRILDRPGFEFAREVDLDVWIVRDEAAPVLSPVDGPVLAEEIRRRWRLDGPVRFVDPPSLGDEDLATILGADAVYLDQLATRLAGAGLTDKANAVAMVARSTKVAGLLMEHRAAMALRRDD